MRRLTLRSLAARKLRTALTAIAVVLGVAMVTGTYVGTDQIRNAFEDITGQTVEGIDVIVTPAEEFTASFGAELPTVGASLAERIAAVPGVDVAEPEVSAYGNMIVDGELVETSGAPAIVVGFGSGRSDPTTPVQGRPPARPGEATVLEQNAERNGIELGEEIGVATRRGERQFTVVGTFAFGEGGSALGGTTMVGLTSAEVQRLFGLSGRATSISVIAEPGADPAELSERVAEVLPDEARAQTAEENAQESADEINEFIGSFLTPALLALAGAAVLVGAFIIFNTFSITVAQRMREFAMLRALGATRRQILAVVAAEALLIGLLASVAGIGLGIGFAELLSSLFDAIGFGIPRTSLVLAPRTIAVALVVGVGVTMLSAMVPVLRATRVPPVAAMAGAPPRPSARSRRLTGASAVLLLLAGAALSAQGLLGSGPATSRLGAIAGGAIAIFIGVALAARYVVRPLADVIGWPIERAFGTPGRLARENAERNPSRTAITSAALMIGLALVVFVAVFTAALKSSIERQLDELVQAEIVVSTENFVPFPGPVEESVKRVDGIDAAVGTLFEQVEVDGAELNVATDVQIGADLDQLPAVYTFDWIEGDDDLIGELGRGETLIEEQFAETHGLEVGERYEVASATGARATMTARGIYRDPTILQGSVSGLDTLAEISRARDPVLLLASVADSADAATVEEDVRTTLERFPATNVESMAEYEETVGGQLDQIVYLFYALLAMSLIISVFGIANSLFLSIHERTGEIGILRAIGTTTQQLRRIIRYESVITSVIGAVLGTLVGVAFAWLVITSLSEFGLSLSIPVGQLGIFMALAVVVGVVGAIAPARRASRTDVLSAVKHE